MPLPNPSLSFSPFAILTAEEMNDLVENDQALSDGTALDIYNYQTDNANTVASFLDKNIKIQVGWGQMAGSGGSTISESVAFPENFTTVLGVLPGLTGVRGAVAANITELTTSYGAAAGYTVGASSITNTGFSVSMSRASGTFGATQYWGYSWIAWGMV